MRRPSDEESPAIFHIELFTPCNLSFVCTDLNKQQKRVNEQLSGVFIWPFFTLRINLSADEGKKTSDSE